METGCPVKSTSGQEGSLARGPLHCLCLRWVLFAGYHLREESAPDRVSETATMFLGTKCPQTEGQQCCPLHPDLLNHNAQGYMGYGTVAGSTVCVNDIFPSIHHWKRSDLVTYTVESTCCAHALQFHRPNQLQIKKKNTSKLHLY